MGNSVTFASVGLSFLRVAQERNIYKRLLKRRYSGRTTLFENLNLHIASGESVALVGPNGSGKTTILKLVAGILAPQRGQVCVGDEAQPTVQREKVGLMMATQLLYESLTGYQNLEYTGHLYRCADISGAINAAIEYWGLKDYIDAPVKTYSAGMRARLAIARATLHKPSVILLDEPTVFLDSDGLERLKNFIQSTRSTVIVTTHQTELIASELDRVIPMESLRAA